jgi:16S rRNA (adenine1518-N6/adenine1519-N6)-dimethyltransferase
VKHAPRKRFGQHFLTDHSVIAAIVSAIAPRAGERLVEIGPGLGALTVGLLERTARLEAVEIDRDLVARLRHRWPPERLVVHEADALAFDFVALAGCDRLRLVGNLPYNISSPLLIGLLASREVIIDQHFMLQKEVVDRMVATPDDSDYGRLSVMLQWRYAMEQVLFVGPQCFDPPPRVDSAVVRMCPLAQPPAVDADLLSQLVQVAFSQRRKLLRHALGPWLDQRGCPRPFDLQRRAQEVPVSEYVALAQSLPAPPGP